MSTPTAPLASAFSTLATNARAPRLIRAMFPAINPPKSPTSPKPGTSWMVAVTSPMGDELGSNRAKSMPEGAGSITATPSLSTYTVTVGEVCSKTAKVVAASALGANTEQRRMAPPAKRHLLILGFISVLFFRCVESSGQLISRFEIAIPSKRQAPNFKFGRSCETNEETFGDIALETREIGKNFL